MKKIALLVMGFILLVLQHYVAAIHPTTQFFIFIAGIILLGVPHGAADLLVAARNANLSGRIFSKQKFLIVYLGRLVLFAVLLFLFPVPGTILFIFFAAYHFGETDLYQFKTDTLAGKVFVISYGMIILGVILLHHFDDVITIYQLLEPGNQTPAFIKWISQHRYSLLSANALLFFVAAFIYFLKNKQFDSSETGHFLVRFACILFILFNLPMLLGFTFYFVVWHSLLSLNNIVMYLGRENTVSYRTIAKQVLLYSILAIAGIGVFGLTGFMFTDENTIAGYIFLSLAVLTAPHMETMYGMYRAIRKDQTRNIL